MMPEPEPCNHCKGTGKRWVMIDGLNHLLGLCIFCGGDGIEIPKDTILPPAPMMNTRRLGRWGGESRSEKNRFIEHGEDK